MTCQISSEKFTQWLNESRPGDVVQIRTRFTWLKKVILAVDDVWLHFHDAKIKKSSLKPDVIKPVMQPQHPVVKEFLRLPKEQQIILRDALHTANIAFGLSSIATAIENETDYEKLHDLRLEKKKIISESFIRAIKKDNDVSYKAKQVAFNLVEADSVALAIDLTVEAKELYEKDKAMLDSIESEIERYFKPKGWILEEIKKVPFWKKSVHRDGVIHRQFVLHGIEAGTNDYIYVKANFDKLTDEQVGEEETHRFKEFKQLVDFLNK